MSNQAVDTTNKGDAQLEAVVNELEADLAFISQIQSWVDKIQDSKTLLDAHLAATRLSASLHGKKSMLQGELMRIRQPDS